ncbi:hypothetical protein [Tenacibaculum halocynthiae]|uniref:hypothetical protein n=1 Tax=Tenacibaculum halocynthiae TaxID=1254437 RepID=UPI003D64782D
MKENKNRLKKSRKWLTDNKVFFEIFSFLFIGGASIFVSYLSYQTSKGQLELQKLEQSPIVILKKEHLKDKLHSLNINNKGFHLFYPDIEIKSYFVVKDYKDTISKRTQNFYFNVKDYFNLKYKTENTVGNIFKIYSANYLKEELIRIRFKMKLNHEKAYNLTNFEHFIKFKYYNNRNELKFKYYFIDPVYNIEVSKEYYNKRLKKNDNNSNRKSYYLKNLNDSIIINSIKKINNRLEKTIDDDLMSDA